MQNGACIPYLGLRILILLGSIPLPPVPLLVYEESEIVIGQSGRGKSPRPLESRADGHTFKHCAQGISIRSCLPVNVAASKSVSTRKSDNFLVIEPVERVFHFRIVYKLLAEGKHI